MSDPYGHGATCDCERCMAWSEGYQAAIDAASDARARRAQDVAPLPNLNRATSYMRSVYNGLFYASSLPPSGLGYLVGLLHGMGREEALLALDAAGRLSPAGSMRWSDITRWLRKRGIADYRPRSGVLRPTEPA